jgi:Bacterial EndoU nuclease
MLTSINLFVSNQADKQERALLIAKIALNINRINIDIFSLFTNSPNFNTYIASQNLEWTTLDIFVNPTTEDFRDYNNNLYAFYEALYSNQLYIQSAKDDEKFYWLARVLSPQGLAVVPTFDKIKLLVFITKLKLLTENNGGEPLALKIVESFTVASVPTNERNDFLYALLENQVYQVTNVYNQTNAFDTHQTLFEVLFRAIDDNRSARYTFGIINTENNRLKFILILYRIWESSRYNPKFPDPAYTQPANQFGIFPESYYMKLKPAAGTIIQEAKYYDSVTSPAILTYNSSTSNSTDYSLSTTDVDFITEIKGKKIEIRKIERTTTTLLRSTRENNQYVNSISSLYGTYDFYQPIAIIGFKPDLNLLESLKDPETGIDVAGSIPVFLLFYMEDFSDLKKIDFGVMLGVEVALTFTGVGGLSKLRYINYLSKARVLVSPASVTASETLLFWEAVQGVNATVQFTAGNALAISYYTGQTTTDQDIKDFTDKLNVLLGLLTLGSLLSSPAMKRKLFDAAADVLAQERKLILAGKVHGLDPAVMNSIRGLYNIDALIDLMQLKLTNLPSFANSNILTRFSAFTKDEKFSFFSYFYNLKEDTKWASMNVERFRIVNNQTQSYTWVDVWKNEIQFLKNNRTYEFLESFHFVRNSDELQIEIFKGRSGKKLKLEFENLPPPHPDNRYTWDAKGVYHIEALQVSGLGGKGRIISGTKADTGPQGLGYYKAKVEIYNPEFPNNGGWKIKKSTNGFSSTFFPDLWSKQKLQEELAFAFANKQYKFSNVWIGQMTDGVRVQFHIDNGIIKTAFPKF